MAVIVSVSHEQPPGYMVWVTQNGRRTHQLLPGDRVVLNVGQREVVQVDQEVSQDQTCNCAKDML